MLLRLSLGLDAAAAAVEAAVSSAVDDGARTKDLGGDASTETFGDAVIERLG
jgi:3-isopropylmalate dehydrogenase